MLNSHPHHRFEVVGNIEDHINEVAGITTLRGHGSTEVVTYELSSSQRCIVEDVHDKGAVTAEEAAHGRWNPSTDHQKNLHSVTGRGQVNGGSQNPSCVFYIGWFDLVRSVGSSWSNQALYRCSINILSIYIYIYKLIMDKARMNLENSL
jgi:hypothetical protein